MAYTSEEIEEISRDPERLRRYFASVAMNARRQALRNRQKSRRMGLAHPVSDYRDTFEEGRDLMRWADTMERVADAISEHIDAFVESSLVRVKGEPTAPPTASPSPHQG